MRKKKRNSVARHVVRGRKILLGVTGGIAAYKACYLVRELVRAGASVKVIMTDSATRFVTPLTFSTLSNNPVATDLWASNQATGSDIGTRHIDLANWADLMAVAPASAQTLAKIASGISDNLLTIAALACTRPIVLAPTMDADMYLNDITQENISRLKERGFFVVPPGKGEHASGLEGPGRLPEVEVIVQAIEGVLRNTHRDLKGKRIVVTAGPTYEAIDPVRFIGNRSSGKMGFAIANAAALRGASVTLVTGPVSLETPKNVRRIDVESANEMYRAVIPRAKKADAVVMAAAVADYKPEKTARRKIKKEKGGRTPELRLITTPDILETLGKAKNGRILVGFALETDNELSNAREKLRRKNLDVVVLNSLKENRKVFGSDMNHVTVIDRSGKAEALNTMPKFDVANAILDRMKEMMERRPGRQNV